MFSDKKFKIEEISIFQFAEIFNSPETWPRKVLNISHVCLVEMFEGDPAIICVGKFSLMLMGVWVTGLKCDNPHLCERKLFLFISFVCFDSRYSSSCPRHLYFEGSFKRLWILFLEAS